MLDNLLTIIDKDRSIADKIPFSHHAEDQVIVTRQGDYLTTIKLVGRTHLAADIADMNKWVQDLNTLIRSIPAEDSDHIAFWTHIDRRREVIDFHKTFNNKFSQDLTDKYIDVLVRKI
ncbi:Type IV secretion system protein virB4 [Moraxella caprae]|uniref:Type IV secretion system protein virB4 n=1 Tax=Moraxella caprae TaxID=90240 RepID=A0A378QL53_9GAMM|nr:Type IV secretion system protein virB4 [Moraxella caprae]